MISLGSLRLRGWRRLDLVGKQGLDMGIGGLGGKGESLMGLFFSVEVGYVCDTRHMEVLY